MANALVNLGGSKTAVVVYAVVLACLALAAPPSAEQALSLRVSPRVASAPAALSITVTVEPHENNRFLVVEDDSESYYRSSEIQLEGDRAARTHRLVFRGLPAGQHRIRAAVRDFKGNSASVSATVIVSGSELLD